MHLLINRFPEEAIWEARKDLILLYGMTKHGPALAGGRDIGSRKAEEDMVKPADESKETLHGLSLMQTLKDNVLWENSSMEFEITS